MAAPGGLIPCRRVENIHGSLKSDEPVSHELPLGWRYAKRSLKIPGKYPLAVHFPHARGNHPLIRAKLSGIRASRGEGGWPRGFSSRQARSLLDRSNYFQDSAEGESRNAKSLENRPPYKIPPYITM